MSSNHWQPFSEVFPNVGITGTIVVHTQFYSPEMDNRRNILVWLPPDYETSGRTYPVIYVHDGQNIFADELSYSGEWGFDETMTVLSKEGLGAIVVGIENTGDGRRTEYSPYDWEYGAGDADRYLKFLENTLKPTIDADFRTMTEPTHTCILGSSMGGLVSLYGVLKSDVFGVAGVFSPYFVPGGGAIYTYVEGHEVGGKRIYMDVGTREAFNMGVDPSEADAASMRYLNGVRQMDDLLRRKGATDVNYLYVEDVGAVHHEGAWSKRLPAAMRFLLR